MTHPGRAPYVGAGLRPALGQVVGKRECVVLRTDLRHALHGSGSLRSGLGVCNPYSWRNSGLFNKMLPETI